MFNPPLYVRFMMYFFLILRILIRLHLVAVDVYFIIISLVFSFYMPFTLKICIIIRFDIYIGNVFLFLQGCILDDDLALS